MSHRRYRSRKGLLANCTATFLIATAVTLFPGWGKSVQAGPNQEKADPTVTIRATDRLTFDPKEVTIEVGEEVQWMNNSALIHTVTADPDEATMGGSVKLPAGAEPFNSGQIRPEGTFRKEFSVPGEYTYFCIPHEAAKMRGTIIVVE